MLAAALCWSPTARGDGPPASSLQRTRLGQGWRVVVAPEPGAGAVVVASSCLLDRVAGQADTASGGSQSPARNLTAPGAGDADEKLVRMGASAVRLATPEVATSLLLVAPAAAELAIWRQARLLAGDLPHRTTRLPALLPLPPTAAAANDIDGPAARRLWALALGSLPPVALAATAGLPAGCPSARGVLTVVGQVGASRALAAARRYLSPAEPQATATRSPVAPGEQHSRRYSSLLLGTGRRAGLLMGWRVAATDLRVRATLQVTAALLEQALAAFSARPSASQTSLALSTEATVITVAGQSLLLLHLALPPATAPEQATERAEQLARALASRGPTPQALAAARRRCQQDALQRLASLPERAHQLAAAELQQGDARAALRLPEALLRVSAAEVKRLASTALQPAALSVVELLPKRPPRQAGRAAPPKRTGGTTGKRNTRMKARGHRRHAPRRRGGKRGRAHRPRKHPAKRPAKGRRR